MKRILYVLTLTFISLSAIAQATFIKHYGDSSGDGNSLIINSSNNYIIAGKKHTTNSDQFTICELNISGDTLWQKDYGTILQEEANQIIETYDGGYALVGYSAEWLDSYSSIYFIKTTNTGTLAWTKQIGGLGHETANSIIQTDAGEYYIAGSSSYNTNGLFDFLLVKTDVNGDTIWTKKYGGSLNEKASSMRQTVDGGFIISGYTESYVPDSTNIYLVRVDSNGDTVWTKHYGGSLEEISSSVRETSDGGYVLTGSTQSFGVANENLYVIKTNSNGDTMWTKTYGQPDRYSKGNDIIQTNDGGYAIAGLIKTASSNGGYDLYIIKINEVGMLEWESEFKIEPSISLFTSSDGRSILQTPDGGFAISGKWYSGSGSELLFVKLNSNGTVRTNELPSNSLCKVFPNPFSQSTILQCENSGTEDYILTLFDREGRNLRTVKTVSSDHIEIERGNLASGIYFYQLRSNREIIATGKFIIE